MKKLVSVLFVSLLVGGMAFAADPTVAVTGWGRMYINVAEGSSASGAVNTISTGPSWQRAGFTVTGTSDNVGFAIDVYATGFGAYTYTDSNGDNDVLDTNETDGDDFFVGDNAKMWVKFGPMATVSLGKVQGNTLRGKLGGGWISSSGLEDDIFARFYPKKGLLVDLAPVDGLYIGAALDTDTNVAVLTTARTLENAYKAIQVGAGYTIKDVGLVRAQYIGSATSGSERIQAAFAYTGMAGLTVDVGGKFAIVADKEMVFAGGAKYAKDAISAAARAKFTTAATSASKPALDIHVDAGYALDSLMSVNLEAKYTGLLNESTTVMAATPYLKLAYAKGEFRAGATLNVSTPNGGTATTTWAIPLGIQFSF